MTEKLLKVNEVSLLVGSSTQTISSWYRWKNLHPDHELAKLLPEYTRNGNKHIRYWRADDVWRLIQFKQNIKQGRNGIMGDVTQKYVKKKERSTEE